MTVAKKGDVVGSAPPETKIPVVSPGLVTMNLAGQVYRHFFVRLPDGMIADDLKEPSIWSKVQLSRNALRMHDHLYMVSFDETWVADAVVAQATADRVVLCRPRITTFPERFERLFDDQNYRVRWVGTGYAVERKSDGRLVTQPVHTAAIAERDLVRLYPARVG